MGGEMIPRTYLFIGPPASGKGTHGKALGVLPGFYHLSMGEVFRGIQGNDEEELGLLKVFTDSSSKGDLMPDDLTMKAFERHLAMIEHTGVFRPKKDILILDGMPRTLAQARLLDDKVDVTKVFVFTTSREEILRRVERRALKERRIDDIRESVIYNRLEIYDRELPQMLDFYRDEQLCEVDTTADPHKVLRHILGLID